MSRPRKRGPAPFRLGRSVLFSRLKVRDDLSVMCPRCRLPAPRTNQFCVNCGAVLRGHKHPVLGIAILCLAVYFGYLCFNLIVASPERSITAPLDAEAAEAVSLRAFVWARRTIAHDFDLKEKKAERYDQSKIETNGRFSRVRIRWTGTASRHLYLLWRRHQPHKNAVRAGSTMSSRFHAKSPPPQR